MCGSLLGDVAGTPAVEAARFEIAVIPDQGSGVGVPPLSLSPVKAQRWADAGPGRLVWTVLSARPHGTPPTDRYALKTDGLVITGSDDYEGPYFYGGARGASGVWT